VLGEQKGKKEGSLEVDKKRMDSIKESERSLLSPIKSDVAESEDHPECAEYWPVCIPCCYQCLLVPVLCTNNEAIDRFKSRSLCCCEWVCSVNLMLMHLSLVVLVVQQFGVGLVIERSLA